MKLHVAFKGQTEGIKSAEKNQAAKNWDLDLCVEFAPDEFVAASKLFNDAYKGIVSDIKPLLEAKHQYRMEELRYEHELNRRYKEEDKSQE